MFFLNCLGDVDILGGSLNTGILSKRIVVEMWCELFFGDGGYGGCWFSE